MNIGQKWVNLAPLLLTLRAYFPSGYLKTLISCLAKEELNSDLNSKKTWVLTGKKGTIYIKQHVCFLFYFYIINILQTFFLFIFNNSKFSYLHVPNALPPFFLFRANAVFRQTLA